MCRTSPILRESGGGGAAGGGGEGEICLGSSVDSLRVLRCSRGRDASEKPEVAPGGRPSGITRVERVEGATWEEAMPPMAPSDRSPTATPELNCSAICLQVPPTPKLSESTFLDLRRSDNFTYGILRTSGPNDFAARRRISDKSEKAKKRKSGKTKKTVSFFLPFEHSRTKNEDRKCSRSIARDAPSPRRSRYRRKVVGYAEATVPRPGTE